MGAWLKGFCATLGLALLLAAMPGCGAAEAPAPVVRIAVPYTRSVRQFSTNYYTQWLQARTGLALEFVEIKQENAEEYLRMTFASGNSTLDAVFMPQAGEGWLSTEALHEFGDQGYILPLEEYIGSDTNTAGVLDSFTAYDLRRAVAAPDGHLYYVPGIQLANQPRSAQTFWINVGWLKTLGLSVPQTTEELEAVLAAFATGDPNGNGVADELPLVGCAGDESMQATSFLMGSFVYNDTENAHMLVENGQVAYAPATGAWREGLGYLAGLYARGLLPDLNFTYTPDQMVQLANDPRDLVGCFAAGSITDVLLQDSPEVISRFIHVAPLESPLGPGTATVQTPRPHPGGVVTATCEEPERVFALLDLMMGEEASLVASYGEQGVDWDFAVPGQVSVYGGGATIHVKNHLSGKVQNKTLSGLGPSALPARYADGVTWSGFEVDQEYIDARANVTYLSHHPREHLAAILPRDGEDAELERVRMAIETYTQAMVAAFVTGAEDLSDDARWQAYLDRLDALGLPWLEQAAQHTYDEGLSARREAQG